MALGDISSTIKIIGELSVSEKDSSLLSQSSLVRKCLTSN